MIRCVAVDDEHLSLDLLVNNISKIPFLKLVGTAKNTLDVIEILQKEQVDLIFLDIQMPGLSGMQLAANLKSRTRVIFLTAFNQYALESYSVNAIDYLVKPVSFERFLEACMKALDVFSGKSTKSVLPEHQSPVALPKFLFVHVEYNVVKIAIDDMLLIEGFKEYVKIHLFSQKRPVITRMSMKLLEEKLAPFEFLRIHKSYIVSLTRVDAIHKSFVKLGELEVPVSEHYKELLMQRVSWNNIL
nr:LytTR family DNA-binding domain-containing protein [Flavihumibacter fluvii]